MTEYFINLTNGLEALTEYRGLPFMFVRLQSTHLELKQFDRFINSVDNNLLMKLALGRRCCIIDYSSNRRRGDLSRACWQGIPFITYCLERAWFKRETEFEHGMHNCFREKYNSLDKPSKKRLKYFKKFLKCDKVRIFCISHRTKNDGNDEFYQNLVKKYL